MNDENDNYIKPVLNLSFDNEEDKDICEIENKAILFKLPNLDFDNENYPLRDLYQKELEEERKKQKESSSSQPKQEESENKIETNIINIEQVPIEKNEEVKVIEEIKDENKNKEEVKEEIINKENETEEKKEENNEINEKMEIIIE